MAVTAGEGVGGVRPSSGAASTEHADAPDFITAPSHSNIAAPEDGRTPRLWRPLSLSGHQEYLCGGDACDFATAPQRAASPRPWTARIAPMRLWAMRDYPNGKSGSEEGARDPSA